MSTKLRWHLDHLDSLRGIAVLGVVMVHSAIWSGSYLPMRSRLVEIAHTGQRGVALFYIVSAFTLFLSYNNRRDEQRPTRNFFIRRFFRVAPMFYVAIVLSVVFLRTSAGSIHEILLSILFLHGLWPTAIMHGAVGGWSVADEALFYMMLPFLFSRIRSLKSALVWMAAATAICYPLSRFLADRFPTRAEYFTFLSISVQLPVFLFGIVAYFTWKEFIAPNSLSVAARKNLSSMFLMLAAVLYCGFLAVDNKLLYPSSLPYLILLMALSVYPWPLFVNRATRLLGKISFSIYLLHFVVFLTIQRWVIGETATHHLLANHAVRWLGCFFVTLFFTVPAAFVTWRWIEEPGIRAGRHIIAQLEGRNLVGKERDLVPPLEAIRGTGNSPDAQF
jgi:peptidoglycan/LPS O-acetylase OafA/YrhL